MLEPMAALEIDTPDTTDTSSLIDGSETTTLDLGTPDFTDKFSVGSVSSELFSFRKLSFDTDGGDMIGGDGVLSFGIFQLFIIKDKCHNKLIFGTDGGGIRLVAMECLASASCWR
jgi:hypothetical protein